jgi:non-homologous end joining protein Ku
VDHYEKAVVAMLKEKQAGITVSRERATPRPQNVVNLMDALRRSIAQERAASAPPNKGRGVAHVSLVNAAPGHLNGIDHGWSVNAAGARWHPQTMEISMASTRPYWKGYLKLSLVSCPIAVYTGTSSTERVSFRQINKKTGHRLRQQLVDEVTREPVEGEDKGRGYEYAKNAYIPVDDDELDAIAIETPRTDCWREPLRNSRPTK